MNQVADGSIYEALNTGDVRYPISVVFSQSVVKEVRTIRYKYVLYFVDRLVGDNALEIQTTAISVIQQIINTIGNNVENISIATGYSIQPFTEKFADECAGAFVQFDIVSENVLGNCSYDEGGDQPILDSYVRKDEVKQSVIDGEKLPISSGAVFTALQNTPLSVEHDDTLNKNGNPDFLHINEAQKALITSTAGIVSGHTGDIESLEANKANTSHTHTKSEVGLANVDNTTDLLKPISNATQTALNSKADTSHTHTKSEVGLANVDNTSDLTKPVSTATQTALNGKADKGTTLADYEIADAYTQAEIDTKLGNYKTYSGF